MMDDGDRAGITSPEIVITAEMIEAGLHHLFAFHPERGVGDDETVRRIFAAMLSARRVGHDESCFGSAVPR